MIWDYGMSCRKHSRRAFLRVMSGALGAWLTLDLSKVAHAAQEARRAQEAAGEAATLRASASGMRYEEEILSPRPPRRIRFQNFCLRNPISEPWRSLRLGESLSGPL